MQLWNVMQKHQKYLSKCNNNVWCEQVFDFIFHNRSIHVLHIVQFQILNIRQKINVKKNWPKWKKT